jgi:hypothetical protein
MLGSATFTIVMSTSSMNVVTQTAISVQRRLGAAGVTTAMPLRSLCDLAETFGGAGPTPLGLKLAIAPRRRRDELAEELFRGQGHSFDSPFECCRVRLRGLLHTADLPNVLQRGGLNLVGRRRRLEVMQDANVAAHARKSKGSEPGYVAIGANVSVCRAFERD